MMIPHGWQGKLAGYVVRCGGVLTLTLMNVKRAIMAKTHANLFLKEVISGQLREAELHEGIQERHLADLEEIWKPALSVLTRWSGRSRREESAHWNWRIKMKRVRLSRKLRSFAIVSRDVTQGMMIVDTSRTVRLKPDCGLGLVYVDYVEVAPWNREGWQPQRVFHSVGTLLVRTAVQASLDLGFDGRIGLHSLPQSNSFYTHLGMTNLGADANYQELCYFEMTPAQALKLRQDDRP